MKTVLKKCKSSRKILLESKDRKCFIKENYKLKKILKL